MNSVLLLLIGICAGIILHNLYLMYSCKRTATLRIDTTNEEKDLYMFEVHVPLESLSKYKLIPVKIAYNTDTDIEEQNT